MRRTIAAHIFRFGRKISHLAYLIYPACSQSSLHITYDHIKDKIRFRFTRYIVDVPSEDAGMHYELWEQLVEQLKNERLGPSQ